MGFNREKITHTNEFNEYMKTQIAQNLYIRDLGVLHFFYNVQ